MFDNTQCNHDPYYKEDSTLDATAVTGRVECRVCHETMDCPHPWWFNEDFLIPLGWEPDEKHCNLCDLTYDPDAKCKAAGHDLEVEWGSSAATSNRLWCRTCEYGEE